jgi:hypothetical protein
MNRPLYETNKDRLAEARVAKRVADTWSCRPVKLRPTYVVDYALLQGDVCKAFMEIKCRNYSMKQMDDMGGFMLSLDKWCKGNELAKAGGTSFVIVVDAVGGIYWYSGTEHDGLSFGGRTDRDDPQDVEPVVLLKAARFKKL